MRPLPPKFEQIVALMDGSNFEGERIAAREAATRLAEDCGWTLQSALAVTRRHRPRPLPPTREQAAAAAEATRRRATVEAEKRKEWEKRIAPIVALYGSIQSALAPCWQEENLLQAVSRWRVTRPIPQERWTATLDGSADVDTMSPRVMSALRRALPLPTSFAEAKKELQYWSSRSSELEALRDQDQSGEKEIGLDLVSAVRRNIITTLIREELRVESIHDLAYRVSIIDQERHRSPSLWNTICRSILELAARDGDSSISVHDVSLQCRIRRALKENRGQSDRAIARQIRCSPTTVGKVRRQAEKDSLSEV